MKPITALALEEQGALDGGRGGRLEMVTRSWAAGRRCSTTMMVRSRAPDHATGMSHGAGGLAEVVVLERRLGVVAAGGGGGGDEDACVPAWWARRCCCWRCPGCGPLAARVTSLHGDSHTVMAVVARLPARITVEALQAVMAVEATWDEAMAGRGTGCWRFFFFFSVEFVVC